jgi:hypothetical protein
MSITINTTVHVQRKGHDLLMTVGGKTTTISVPEFLRKHYPNATDEQITQSLAIYDDIDKESTDAGTQSE